MEIIKIFNKKEKFVGELGVFDDLNFSYKGEGDEILDLILKKALGEGVVGTAFEYNLEEDSVEHKVVILKKENDNFLEALSLILGQNGYKLARNNEKEDEEIKKILENFENSSSDKIDILDRLDSMSKLEKSLILRELKKIESE